MPLRPEYVTTHESLYHQIIENPSVFGDLIIHYQNILDALNDNAALYQEIKDADRKDVVGAIVSFFEQSGLFLQAEIYRDFAFANGYTKRNGEWELYIPLYELSDDQHAEWRKYLASEKFITHMRLTCAINLGKLVYPTVSIKYKSDAYLALKLALEQAKRELVLKFFTNISDEEAMLINRNYTAATIRQTPTLDDIQ
jgi:hypothetical protein